MLACVQQYCRTAGLVKTGLCSARLVCVQQYWTAGLVLACVQQYCRTAGLVLACVQQYCRMAGLVLACVQQYCIWTAGLVLACVQQYCIWPLVLVVFSSINNGQLVLFWLVFNNIWSSVCLCLEVSGLVLALYSVIQ